MLNDFKIWMCRTSPRAAFAWAVGPLVAGGMLSACFVSSAQAKALCVEGPKTLGVSRTVEIDTSSGPKFGHQQYRDIDFLADGEIVLTFDDGPLRPYTQPVVDALEAQCTKATFFMVGSMALGDPAMVRDIAAKGHTIGTHTWSHANLKKLTPLKARAEIELGFSAVQNAAGRPIAPFFRFPFLADAKSMVGYAQTRGVGIFSIEVDAIDYRTKDPAVVHQTVLNQLATMKKGILLFHDIQPATARALPGLLAALKAKGYRVVHMKPKGSATTLPEFDAMVQKENGRRRVATASSPLAPRSLTWQATGAPPASQSEASALPPMIAQPPRTNPKTAAVPAPPGPAPGPIPLQNLPPSQPTPVPAETSLPPLPPVSRPARGPIEDDWRARVFRGG
jgi:peptidoglycan-N-acetylglucosamine deacetylase